MRKSQIVLCGSFILAAMGLGCAQSAKDTIDDVKADLGSSELQHSWKQEKCKAPGALSLIGGSTQTTYEISGNDVKKTVQFFSEGDCKDLAANVTYAGTFEKKDEVQKNIHQINISYNSASITAVNEAGQKVLNTGKVCGVSNWAVNVAVDVSASERGVTCPLPALPQAIFDIYTVENNTLFLGKDGDKNTPAARPAELDREELYHQL